MKTTAPSEKVPKKKALRLSELNIDFFAELHDVIVEDTRTVAVRHFPNDKTYKATIRRLKEFEEHGLIRSLIVSGYSRKGYIDAIHRLTSLGAGVLARHRNIESTRVLKNDPSPQTLLHRLAVGSMLLSLSDACRKNNLPKSPWILEYDFERHATGQESYANRYILHETFDGPDPSEPIMVRPDAAALLRIPSEELIMIFERDMGSETEFQFLSKLPGLYELLRTHRYLRPWQEQLQSSTPLVRIFCIFESDERLQNIARRMERNPALLWLRKKEHDRRLYFIDGLLRDLTDDDLETAKNFLSTFFRFATKADLNADMLTTPVWRAPWKLNQSEWFTIYPR